MKRRLAPLLLALLPITAWGQQPAPEAPPSPPITDLQIEHDRAEMLQAQLQYFLDVVKRTEAKDKELAAWWAAYIGLPRMSEK